MTKTELRKIYKTKRSKLPEEQIDQLSLLIANKLLQLPIWNRNYYHIFLPITHLKEINTEYILHILQGKDKSSVVSKSNFSTYKMTHYLLQDHTKIIVNHYGIPEPEDGLEIPAKTLDVVFIPLLAFDIKGNRIGYGKGFYDRFLKKCKPNCVKIGLSFFNAEPEFLDITANDIMLNYAVTPNTIYSF